MTALDPLCEWIAEHPQRQNVYLRGFDAGLAAGITLGGFNAAGPAARASYEAGVAEGRRQVEAEDARRWADLQLERDAIQQLVSHRRRTTYDGPGLSGSEVRTRAARSWGLDLPQGRAPVEQTA